MSTAKPMTPPLTVEELMRLVEAYADADHICCLTAVNDTERGDGNRSRTEKAYVDVVATRDALRASLERALARYDLLAQAVNENSLPCDPECDSFAHTETCKHVNIAESLIEQQRKLNALAQQKEALPTNTRDAIAVLYSHDLREEAERLETVSDGCKCVDCTDTGVVEPASLPEEPSERSD